MRIGLALGAGGARGWCHIGVLRELQEQGIVPDVVAGCSMGALVGAAWASERLNALEDWARALTRQRFLTYVDLRLSGGGLVRGRTVLELLGDLGVAEDFEGLDRPFLAVATDMATGHEVWLRDGSVRDAVRASISIPGVVAPHRVNGRWLLDGGLINPVPVSACRALGADLTIAVNPNGKPGPVLWRPRKAESGFWEKLGQPEFISKLTDPVRDMLPRNGGDDAPEAPPPHYLDVVSTAMDIMSEYLRKTREAGDPPHLSLSANLTNMAVLEMHRAEEAIEEGRRIAKGAGARLEELRAMM
ncbi:patatin-like phospholipase family protein [Roseovarius salinarum]|uniref:patatin-like phospholipase family protein n=1 Tax=Roseovarius salinarum TaxID=1981892 RepID=UPI0013000240|nr:patatin-like phospholipase family protein [Roseovarius salinarum]